LPSIQVGRENRLDSSLQLKPTVEHNNGDTIWVSKVEIGTAPRARRRPAAFNLGRQCCLECRKILGSKLQAKSGEPIGLRTAINFKECFLPITRKREDAADVIGFLPLFDDPHPKTGDEKVTGFSKPRRYDFCLKRCGPHRNLANSSFRETRDLCVAQIELSVSYDIHIKLHLQHPKRICHGIATTAAFRHDCPKTTCQQSPTKLPQHSPYFATPFSTGTGTTAFASSISAASLSASASLRLTPPTLSLEGDPHADNNKAKIKYRIRALCPSPAQ
jgi:hypothetical protein